MTYNHPESAPAIRKHTRDNPTVCPWCGQKKWFVSDRDDARDNGRVQMYCDHVGCVSRETELIMMRGEGANARADVRALRAIDDGHHVGDVHSLSSFALGDPRVTRRMEWKREHRIEWRHSEAPFDVVPRAGNPDD